MEYRREIDGLRAVAVLPVILFHAGFQTFRGGFVGVDVFFVISGYLITSIILSEKAAGTFRLANFYERRARRILPALFLVMAACLPFAWLWLLPADTKSFTTSLAAVVLFLSNFYFKNQSGYFDTAAELKPMLHTWSLAVEEQYYLFFPLFLAVVWRFGRQFILAALGVVAVLSLALAQWASHASPAAAFFLLPMRGWELLIGAFLAFHFAHAQRRECSRATSELGALAGMLLLAYAVFAFDSRTPFPSVYTLVPTLGTALIILFATPRTRVGAVLGSKVLVGVGLASYSAYLWHQPLLAFARHRMMDEPDQLLLGLLAVASLVLAYFSWKYVEAPFRDRSRFDRRFVFACAAFGSAFFVAIGWAGYVTKGFDHRLSASQREILRYGESGYTDPLFQRAYRLGTCFLTPEQDARAFVPGCRASGAEGNILIWGDSHAAALSHGLRQHFPNVSQYNASGCPPIHEASTGARPHCKAVNDHLLGKLAELAPTKVFLHANWSIYGDLDAVGTIHKTIQSIRATVPAAEIIVVGPVPRWNPSLPVFLLRRRVALDGEHFLANPTWAELRHIDAALREQATREGARFLSPLQALCTEGKCMATVKFRGEVSPTAWDEAHLTEAGSIALITRLLAGSTD